MECQELGGAIGGTLTHSSDWAIWVRVSGDIWELMSWI